MSLGAGLPLVELGAASRSANRFLVVAVACQRVVQLRNGARTRLDPNGHKPCVVAVAEVVAGTVPYDVG